MDLVEAIEHAIDGNAVLFVGSGFSRSAKNLDGQPLKTGGQLAEFLGEECGLSAPASLDDVAELYVAKQGTTKLVNLLTRQFQVSELGSEHPIFGYIPWKRIYTTNYDNTIELAYKANKRPIVPITLEDSIRRVREASAQCIHINGFINDLTDETLFTGFKLTDTSYSSSLLATSPIPLGLASFGTTSQQRKRFYWSDTLPTTSTSRESCSIRQKAVARPFSLSVTIQTNSLVTNCRNSVASKKMTRPAFHKKSRQF